MPTSGTYYLKIEGDGAWRVDLVQPSLAGGSSPPANFSATGFNLTYPITYTGNLKVTYQHSGKSNFSILAYTNAGRDDLLANEIGAVSGSTTYRARGPFVFAVEADGAWTITIAVL